MEKFFGGQTIIIPFGCDTAIVLGKRMCIPNAVRVESK